MSAIPIAMSTRASAPAIKWVPRTDLPPKKAEIDPLIIVRALSGIPIHALQELVNLNHTGRPLINVRQLILDGEYDKVYNAAFEENILFHLECSDCQDILSSIPLPIQPE